MTLSIQSTREDHRIAWFSALAIAIHLLEATLPSPLPGVKPGLANVVTITVLCLYGWRVAAWVNVFRVVIGSILLGTFLTPTFMMSASGAASALLAVGLVSLLNRVPGVCVGPLGYSVLAALAHMSGQFMLAYMLFIPHPGLFKLFPVLMSLALLFGVLSGIIAQFLLKRIT